MNRYKYTKLRNLGPVHGFLIQTPDDRQLKDLYPQFIVFELNHLNDRIHQLIAERDTARLQADQRWNLRKEFESLLGTSDITTGIGMVKTLIQASKDAVELRKQAKEQKARIKRLAQSCVAKDEQICNLLEICRSNGIEVSSQDLLRKEEA